MTRHILTIDDDALFREIATATFANAGYTIDEAEDGEHGLALMRRQKPDVVLLDVVMPRLDGFQTLEAMKTDNTLCDIPVVIVTGQRAEKDVRRALALGITDYVTKPTTPRALLERVERIFAASPANPDDIWLL
jgi:two-component system phosphate regulon response regulator PhoB